MHIRRLLRCALVLPALITLHCGGAEVTPDEHEEAAQTASRGDAASAVQNIPTERRAESQDAEPTEPGLSPEANGEKASAYQSCTWRFYKAPLCVGQCLFGEKEMQRRKCTAASCPGCPPNRSQVYCCKTGF